MQWRPGGCAQGLPTPSSSLALAPQIFLLHCPAYQDTSRKGFSGHCFLEHGPRAPRAQITQERTKCHGTSCPDVGSCHIGRRDIGWRGDQMAKRSAVLDAPAFRPYGTALPPGPATCPCARPYLTVALSTDLSLWPFSHYYFISVCCFPAVGSQWCHLDPG